MEWLNLKQLVIATGLSERQAKRILKAGSYKGIPLEVYFRKTPKGQTEKIVRWETNNSQLVEVVPLDSPKSTTQAVAVKTDGSFLGGIGEVVPVYLQSEAVTAEVFGGNCKDKFITPVKGDEERVPPHFEDEQGVLTLEQEFENLLAYKIQGKSESAKKVMRARYRKQFRETGKIPLILQGTGKDGRKNSGRRTELPPEIVEEFVNLVIGSADRTNPKTFRTQSLRTITGFQLSLEKKFDCKISYKSLSNVVKKYELKSYFLMPDVEDESRLHEPSFWGAVPVGEMLQMDGVTADYIRILIDGKYREPTWIEFFDVGSRRLMAMDVYSGETNKNSVDIFNKLLMNTKFPCTGKGVSFRPDNGKSFLNLRRCFEQINRQHAASGFFIIDDFARPLEAKDKAHLESSHRALHKFELQIINYFHDRVVATNVKNKNIGGKGDSTKYKKITVLDLDITIEELRESGLTQEYVRLHNERYHRPTSGGKQKRWIPEEKWNAYVAQFERFAQFTEEDYEHNRIQGFTKSAKSVGKNGQFIHNGRTYALDKEIRDKFSRTNSTKVKISDIGNGVIAIFQDADDGVFIGKAYALQAPKNQEKVTEIREAKVARIVQGGTLAAIKKQLDEYGIMVNEQEIDKMIDSGLTVEMTAEILAENNALRYSTEMKPMAKFRSFNGAFNAKKNVATKGKMSMSVN